MPSAKLGPGAWDLRAAGDPGVRLGPTPPTSLQRSGALGWKGSLGVTPHHGRVPPERDEDEARSRTGMGQEGPLAGPQCHLKGGGERPCGDEAEAGVAWPQPGNTCPPRSWTRQGGPSSLGLRGGADLLTLAQRCGAGPRTSGTVTEEMHEAPSRRVRGRFVAGSWPVHGRFVEGSWLSAEAPGGRARQSPKPGVKGGAGCCLYPHPLPVPRGGPLGEPPARNRSVGEGAGPAAQVHGGRGLADLGWGSCDGCRVRLWTGSRGPWAAGFASPWPRQRLEGEAAGRPLRTGCCLGPAAGLHSAHPMFMRWTLGHLWVPF